MIHPYGAMALGSIVGVVSVLGYKYVTPALASRVKLLDTCGVHNLHGMPGVISATACERVLTNSHVLCVTAAVVAIAVANVGTYGERHFHDTFTKVYDGGDEFTIADQAMRQAAALAVTLALAIGGGVLTGFTIRWRFCNALSEEQVFEDGKWWHLPAEVLTVHMHDHEEGIAMLNKKAVADD